MTLPLQMRTSFKMFDNITYRIFIHDPTFFLIYGKQNIFPGLRMKRSFKDQVLVFDLSIIKHVDLNRESSPCIEDPNYNFQLCVRNSLVRKVGCRLPWDRWSTQDFPTCTEVKQLKRFEELYRTLAYVELKTTIDITGCMKPCHYKKYTLDGEEKWNSPCNPSITMQFTSTDVVGRKK